MAHCLRRPVLPPAGLQFLIPLQQRPFSIGSPRWVMARAAMPAQPRQQSERSVQVASKEMGKMSNDLGILPQTIIFPRRSNLPNPIYTPRAFLKLNYLWLKRRLQATFSLMVYKYLSKPRLKILPRQVAPTALGLHRQMYSAFAEGDIKLLDSICCDGIRQSFRSRIAARPRGERWEWELVKYTKRAKVLSHRAASLGIEGLGIRQAVVRIASRQKLTRYRADGSVVPGSGREKDTVEYFVVQRMLRKGVEDEWMVWGTTEETTLEMIEEEEMAGMTERS